MSDILEKKPSMKSPVFVIGKGGHAITVSETIRRQQKCHFAGFVEPRNFSERPSDLIDSVSEAMREFPDALWVIGLGDNIIRSKINSYLVTHYRDIRFHTCIDPSAVVFESSSIGEGSVVMAGAVVGAQARVGRHCIINTNSSIDHESSVADFASLGPNSSIAGKSSIGTKSHLGIGANVIEKVSLGDNSIVGGGSIVTRNLGENGVFLGSPARLVRERNAEEPMF